MAVTLRMLADSGLWPFERIASSLLHEPRLVLNRLATASREDAAFSNDIASS